MLTALRLLRFAAENKASDVHVSAGEAPMVRIDGDMRRVDWPALTPEEAHRLIFDVMNDAQRRVYQERLELDFAITLGENLRFRVNAFVQNRGEAAVFRSIPTRIPKAEDLHLPEILYRLCSAEKGLLLVTGATGSGKSTTLAALIDWLNRTQCAHILTLEDPIEFVHVSQRSLVNQREVGSQTHSFTNALRSALREDPDVILIGEMRDLETIALALTAAETGHLVLGTLHTSSAPKAVDRILDTFPAEQQAQARAQLAETLLGVCTQMLFKRVGGGRCAAHELLVGTPAVRNLIRENKTFQMGSVIQAGARYGMKTMEAAIGELYKGGLVTREEIGDRLPAIAQAMEDGGPGGERT